MPAADLFDDATMAAGYASDRPPVHPHLMARLAAGPGWDGRAGRALDLGCGAGASTAALVGLAERVVGIDPFAPMIDAARRTVGGAAFAVAGAEAVPIATGSVDLLAAAGSLNFADLDACIREADRLLAPGGVVAISNYGLGRPDGPGPTGWTDEFAARWPRPPARPVTAATFAGGPFRVVVDDEFAVGLPMTLAAYVAYLMTETGVAAAVAAGASPDTIRRACVDRLAPGWDAVRPVVFACSLLVLTR